MSLRDPVLNPTARREAPSFGLVKLYRLFNLVTVFATKIPENVLFNGTGWTDSPEKCPLNFFIICGYIDYVYIYLYTK